MSDDVDMSASQDQQGHQDDTTHQQHQDQELNLAPQSASASDSDSTDDFEERHFRWRDRRLPDELKRTFITMSQAEFNKYEEAGKVPVSKKFFESEIDRLSAEPKIYTRFENEEPQSESYLCRLPDEILVKIFDYLSVFQLFQISVTCKRLSRLTRERSLFDGVHLTIEGYRGCQNYDPLVQLEQKGEHQKKMVLGPERLEMSLAMYSRNIHKLTLKSCIFDDYWDVLSILKALPLVNNLSLNHLEIPHSNVSDFFTKGFQRLHSAGKFQLKTLTFYDTTLENIRLRDLTAIIPRAEIVHMGHCGWNEFKSMRFYNLELNSEMLGGCPESDKKIKKLTVYVSRVEGSTLGDFSKTLTQIEEVDLLHSKLERRYLDEIAEEIKGCSNMKLRKITYENKEYSPSEFARKFTMLRPRIN